MSFLQPWILFGLALTALPIIIHLLNRLRHRPLEWGAMMFLRAATRESRGHRKLRQVLIMLCRMAAIAGLVFAVSRPLSSGFLGSFGASVDTAIIILDRSPSMAYRDLQTGRSNRSFALERVVRTLETTGVPPTVVLIDSGTGTATRIEALDALPDLPDTGATDASSHIPSLLETALEYMRQNRSGRTDIWICSDTQHEDWDTRAPQWPSIRSGFAEIEQSVRFFLLSYGKGRSENLSVRVEGVQRLKDETRDELSLDIVVKRERGVGTKKVSLALIVDGARSVLDIEIEGSSTRLKDYPIPLDGTRSSGFGRVELPEDSNPRDNVFYFAYGESPTPRTVIVCEDRTRARPLALAVAPPDDDSGAMVEFVTPEEIGTIAWEEIGLILWQAGLPGGSRAVQLEEFVAEGGVVLFLPPREGVGTSTFMDVGWGADFRAPHDGGATVSSWRNDSGLLRKALSGRALPFDSIRVHRGREIQGRGTVLAELSFGKPLLLSVPSEVGGVYFLATSPVEPDSNLARQGIVYFIMLQRALEDGSRRLSEVLTGTVGETVAMFEDSWTQLDGWEEGLLSTQEKLIGGVYKTGERMVARNRPESEDTFAPLESEETAQLFEGLDYRVIDDNVRTKSPLVQEIWKLFLAFVIVALIGEALLCMPRSRRGVGKEGLTT